MGLVAGLGVGDARDGASISPGLPDAKRGERLMSSANRLRVTQHIDRLGLQIAPYVPFTLYNTVDSVLGKDARTVLDVGCGNGRPMRFFRRNANFYAVGADIFEPYLRECKQRRTHDELVLCSVTDIGAIFPERSFDLVICLEVLEHLHSRADGFRVLDALERIARRQVIVTTPVGECISFLTGESIYQEHHVAWQPQDLRNRGYRVYGQGIWKYDSADRFRRIRVIRYMLWAASILAGPLVRHVPQIAGHLVAVKRLA
jgi:SAM-dependent methyltransferase